MKACKQCGVIQADAEFREYYNNKGNRCNVCNKCEKINSRRKYLEKKSKRSESEDEELQLIFELYSKLRLSGLKPPRVLVESSKDLVVQQLAELTTNQNKLRIWLTADLSTYTPDDLDVIYDELKTEYAPTVGFDNMTKLPKYDTTYLDVLDSILQRFNEHEEDYYRKVAES